MKEVERHRPWDGKRQEEVILSEKEERWEEREHLDIMRIIIIKRTMRW